MSKKKPAFTNEEIAGVECRFATYIPPARGTEDDYHLVKEIVHLKDGSRVPNLRILKNFKRSFWVTKEGYRKHTQKKEWEDIKKLTEYRCTQSQLLDRAAKALGKFGFNGGLRKLSLIHI